MDQLDYLNLIKLLKEWYILLKKINLPNIVNSTFLINYGVAMITLLPFPEVEGAAVVCYCYC